MFCVEGVTPKRLPVVIARVKKFDNYTLNMTRSSAGSRCSYSGLVAASYVVLMVRLASAAANLCEGGVAEAVYQLLLEPNKNPHISYVTSFRVPTFSVLSANAKRLN